MTRTFLLSLLLITTFTACDRPECKNNNPVFDKYTPEQREYKAELIKQLKATKSNTLRFWIDQYIAREGRTFMSVYVQGDGLCAKGILDITDVPTGNRLQYYKQVGGGGYSGAELDGLKFRIDSSNGDYQFIYENVKRIID